jgi:hypothetical protein
MRHGNMMLEGTMVRNDRKEGRGKSNNSGKQSTHGDDISRKGRRQEDRTRTIEHTGGGMLSTT